MLINAECKQITILDSLERPGLRQSNCASRNNNIWCATNDGDNFAFDEKMAKVIVNAWLFIWLMFNFFKFNLDHGYVKKINQNYHIN